MQIRKDGEETRRRILETACDVFGEKGYRDATHAEICQRAGVNTAAINYHFHDKETLYREAWRLAFERSLVAHPVDAGVPSTAAAEERLHGLILSLMRRIADPRSQEFEIVHKELANPTGLLAEVIRESIDPICKRFEAVVRGLLGPKVPPIHVRLCQQSIRSQCFDLMIRERRRRSADPATARCGPPPLDLSVEAIAAHIIRFSLAGIREVRHQCENGMLADGE